MLVSSKTKRSCRVSTNKETVSRQSAITPIENNHPLIDTNVTNINNVEYLVFSGKVIKYNRFGMKQERVIMLTNLYLSNIKKKCRYFVSRALQYIASFAAYGLHIIDIRTRFGIY